MEQRRKLTADKGYTDYDGEDHEDDDPHGAVQVGPELEKHTYGRDLGGNAKQIAVDEIPADGELPGRVNEKASMSDETASDLRSNQQRDAMASGRWQARQEEGEGVRQNPTLTGSRAVTSPKANCTAHTMPPTMA